MPIRVALSVAILAAGIASAVAAGAPMATVTAFSFGCPSIGVTNEGNAIWKSKGYDKAWAEMKPKGCKPMLGAISKVLVIHGGDDAKCVVKSGEMGPCVWMPADRLKLD